MVLLRRRAARPGAGNRADGHLAVLDPDQDLRARAGDGEVAEVEIVEVGRGIHPAERPVEGEGRQGERRLEALRQHDLEDVAGADVVLRPRHHVEVALRGRVGDDRPVEVDVGVARRFVQAHVERVDHRSQTLDGTGMGLGGAHAGRRTDGGHHGDLVADGVEDDDHGRANQHRVGKAERIRRRRPERFHLADHVVAEIAEDSGCHRREARRQGQAGFGDDGAESVERLPGQRVEDRTALGIAIDLGLAVPHAEDQVGCESDDRIAAADRAAFDGFEEEAVGAARRQLEHRRNRRFEIGHQPRPDHAGAAGIVGLRGDVCGGLDQHGVSEAIRARRRGGRSRWRY